ncbi:thiamine phosphate synthase [Opitutaceae bacterium TAV4]|nr:thiamine phosphate synthase [Opitutaceae bacterium TAV4]
MPSSPFHLAVISPPDEHPRELALLPALFDAGLTRYHIRKPTWTRARLAAHLAAIPQKHHPRLILHTHHDLAAAYAIGGFHDRQSGAGVSPASDWHKHFFPTAALLRSRPIHTLAELHTALTTYPPTHDTLLVSPIFPSISKPDHAPSPTHLPLPELSAHLHARPFRKPHSANHTPQILALGGITPDRLATTAALGFDGAAILGALWQSPDPLATWRTFQSKIPKLPPPPPPPPPPAPHHHARQTPSGKPPRANPRSLRRWSKTHPTPHQTTQLRARPLARPRP